jgi:ABC-type sugar transport system ATPase subunit
MSVLVLQNRETQPVEGILKAADIRRSYGALDVLKGTSLRCEPGERLVILGESGEGKTTLLEILSGLECPDSGHVLVGDREITQHSSRERDMGFVFQDKALWDGKTVEDHLKYPLEWRGYAENSHSERIKRVLSLVRLTKKRRSRVDNLSGGQRQRVGLARALVTDPTFILMDEPFSDLDPPLRATLRQEVVELQEQLGFGLIFVTHDSQEALELADRLMILHHGRVVQEGPPSEIVEAPASEHVARFLGYQNIVEAGGGGDGDDERKGLAALRNGTVETTGNDSPMAILPPGSLSLSNAPGEPGDATVDATVVDWHYRSGGGGTVKVEAFGFDDSLRVDVENPTLYSIGETMALHVDRNEVIWISPTEDRREGEIHANQN